MFARVVTRKTFHHTRSMHTRAFSARSRMADARVPVLGGVAAAAAVIVVGGASLCEEAPIFTAREIERIASGSVTAAAVPKVPVEESTVVESSPSTAASAAISVYDFPLKGKNFPKEAPCFIEVSKGSRNKYEWDEKNGFLRLDRVLHSAVFYPHNYGFLPQTLCGDGDPLDVLVLGEVLVPGCIVDVRPLAYMLMQDEKGLDEKVLAVPVNDPRFSEYRTLRDIPEHLLREIAHFFGTYKALEKEKWSKIGGWKGTEDTRLLLEQTHAAYVKTKGKK